LVILHDFLFFFHSGKKKEQNSNLLRPSQCVGPDMSKLVFRPCVVSLVYTCLQY
jgi:hypothetical protein